MVEVGSKIERGPTSSSPAFGEGDRREVDGGGVVAPTPPPAPRGPPPAARGGFSNRFHDQRIDDHFGGFVPIAEAPAMKLGELRAHLLGGANRDFERRIASGRPQARAAIELDPSPANALLDQRVARRAVPARRALPKNPRRAASASSPRGSPSRRRFRFRRRTARRRADGPGSAPCRARPRRGRRAARPRRRSRRACSA